MTAVWDESDDTEPAKVGFDADFVGPVAPPATLDPRIIWLPYYDGYAAVIKWVTTVAETWNKNERLRDTKTYAYPAFKSGQDYRKQPSAIDWCDYYRSVERANKLVPQSARDWIHV